MRKETYELRKSDLLSACLMSVESDKDMEQCKRAVGQIEWASQKVGRCAEMLSDDDNIVISMYYLGNDKFQVQTIRRG